MIVTQINSTEVGSTNPHSPGEFIGDSDRTRYGFIGTGSESSSFDGARGPEIFLHAYLGEIVYYERGLDSNELILLENYLQRKWGTQ